MRGLVPLKQAKEPLQLSLIVLLRPVITTRVRALLLVRLITLFSFQLQMEADQMEVIRLVIWVKSLQNQMVGF